jgi:hypothetical protein
LSRESDVFFDCCPSPPLEWSDLTAQALIDCARTGIVETVDREGGTVFHRPGVRRSCAPIRRRRVCAGRVHGGFSDERQSDVRRPRHPHHDHAQYWVLKGLEIQYAPDNGIKCEGGHITFEQCVFHHNGDGGLQIGLNKDTFSTNPNPDYWAAYNTVINCDSYRNADPATSYENADGFSCKLYAGKGNYYYGCRAWENCDDGYDCYQTEWEITFDHCWSWHNGDPSLWGFSSFSGDGIGDDIERTVEQAQRMVEEGADIIDVGGESTRPGTKPMSVTDCEEELRLVIPAIERLADELTVPISIDTYKSAVAQRAIEAGTEIINDISGLHF